LVHPNLSYAQYLYLRQGELWFAARDQNSVVNVEVWRSLGLESNTARMTDIASGIASSNPFGFFNASGRLCFFAQTSSSAVNLYSYPQAQTFTFAPTQPGNAWNQPANWSTGTLPAINDAVVISAGLQAVVSEGNAYAGTLTMASGTGIVLSNTSDTLILGKKLVNQGSNTFSGNGVLALKPAPGATFEISGGFSMHRIAFFGNTALPPDPVIIKP
jgi:ELWxxDGT repeat protein